MLGAAFSVARVYKLYRHLQCCCCGTQSAFWPKLSCCTNESLSANHDAGAANRRLH